jgi:Spondin_N.
MTLRSSLSRPLFAVLLIACAGLVIAGCDSSGDNGTADPETFEVTLENVGSGAPILKSGAFTPSDVINDNNNLPPLEPGEAFQFSFTAGPNEIPGSGMRLSFASMFVQSNDVYYAFEPGGLSLFDGSGNPIGMSSPADVTGSVSLYDAGTEVDQEPGTGADQAPRQENVGDGMDENGTVARIEENDNGVLEDDGFTYPAVAEGIEMTVSSQKHAGGGYQFTVTIDNVSDETGATANDAPIVLSPGTYAVHWAQTPSDDPVTYPGHTPGEEASDGIARIAEDGRPGSVEGVPGNHVGALGELTGVTVPLSPGAAAVHSDNVSLFETGTSASGGIEAIAEDGRPNGAVEGDAGSPAGNLVASLTGTDGIESIAPFGGGPIPPGNEVSFNVEATPGDRLSLATMYIQSNDLFYATPQEGIALYDSNDQPIDREIDVALYDAGTEGDQEPGVGLEQAPRQSSLNTGPSGEGSVTQVSGSNDGYSYPATGDIIRVTITPPSQ